MNEINQAQKRNEKKVTVLSVYVRRTYAMPHNSDMITYIQSD